MKIIFLNIWNCTQKEEVLNFLKQQVIDTDVFCLQEAYEKTKWLCRDILSDFELLSDYKYINDSDDFSQATYIRRSINIISKSSSLKENPSMGLSLQTQIIFNNKVVSICNSHGVSKPGDKQDTEERIEQSQLLMDSFTKLPGLKILGGDLNLEIDTDSIKYIEKKGYRNLIRECNITTTRNKLVWDRYPDTKLYYSDYVFIDNDVLLKEFLVPEIEISDHLPLILEIEV
jgi:hypothetical protein